MGCRDSGSTRYSGELAARAAGNIVFLMGMEPVLADMLQYSCLENPTLAENPGRPQSTGLQRVETQLK